LEKQYVQRIIDSTDRRKRPLRVTAKKGKALLDEVIPFALLYEEGLKNCLSADEWPQLNSLINKLFETATSLNSNHL